MVEVNCETDFVAKDENFKTFCQEVLNYCLKNNSKSVEEISNDLESDRQGLVQKVGENVIIRKKESIIGDNLYSYIHSNGKVGALVSLKDDNEELGKDIAMHVTASNPKFLSPEDVDSETIEKEKQILKAQVEDTNKPEEIIEKMVEGRLNKFLSEISLLKQPFVKDPSTSIENILNDHKNSIVEFTRIEVGEGIEVEQKDFASEVQAQLQNS
jgi:elongation factor Ts